MRGARRHSSRSFAVDASLRRLTTWLAGAALVICALALFDRNADMDGLVFGLAVAASAAALGLRTHPEPDPSLAAKSTALIELLRNHRASLQSLDPSMGSLGPDPARTRRLVARILDGLPSDTPDAVHRVATELSAEGFQGDASRLRNEAIGAFAARARAHALVDKTEQIDTDLLELAGCKEPVIAEETAAPSSRSWGLQNLLALAFAVGSLVLALFVLSELVQRLGDPGPAAESTIEGTGDTTGQSEAENTDRSEGETGTDDHAPWSCCAGTGEALRDVNVDLGGFELLVPGSVGVNQTNDAGRTFWQTVVENLTDPESVTAITGVFESLGESGREAVLEGLFGVIRDIIAETDGADGVVIAPDAVADVYVSVQQEIEEAGFTDEQEALVTSALIEILLNDYPGRTINGSASANSPVSVIIINENDGTTTTMRTGND